MDPEETKALTIDSVDPEEETSASFLAPLNSSIPQHLKVALPPLSFILQYLVLLHYIQWLTFFICVQLLFSLSSGDGVSRCRNMLVFVYLCKLSFFNLF